MSGENTEWETHTSVPGHDDVKVLGHIDLTFQVCSAMHPLEAIPQQFVASQAYPKKRKSNKQELGSIILIKRTM